MSPVHILPLMQSGQVKKIVNMSLYFMPTEYGLGDFSYFRFSSSALGSTTKVPDTTYAPCPAHKISKAAHCIDSAVCFVLPG